MNIKKFLTILTVVIALALTATAAYAAVSQYILPSGPMVDPLDPGVSWQRDTTNQNAIAQHTADEFPDTPYVETAFHDPSLTVQVYHAAGGPNVTALIYGIYGTDLWLVGPGGGRTEANNAKIAFQNATALLGL